jgi:tRNA (guanine37-N1)-methyltransferase
MLAGEETLQVAVVTLFPGLFTEFSTTSFVGRAQTNGLFRLNLIDLRAHGLGVHKSVDDTPYGGGSGMVMRVDCLMAAIAEAEERLGGRAHRVLLTPQGTPHSATTARALAAREKIVLICGRYEGFDERVRHFVDEEISLGDFVLTGGEIPAMAIIESTIRFRPGILGNEDSVREESFSEALAGGLEYPQYTRPAEYAGLGVPEVLKSGDHKKIAAFRREQSALRTESRRPDLRPGTASAEKKEGK